MEEGYGLRAKKMKELLSILSYQRNNIKRGCKKRDCKNSFEIYLPLFVAIKEMEYHLDEPSWFNLKMDFLSSTNISILETLKQLNSLNQIV